MKKLRVLHVIIGHGFGGLENVVLDLVRAGDKDRFSYYILCLSSPDVVRRKLEASGATVLELGYGRGLHFGLPLAIRRVVREYAIDIVHSHDFNPFFYTTLACLGRRKLARVYTEHSSVLSLGGRHHWVIRLFSHANDAMVMVSGHLQRHYADHVGVSDKRTVVIHNGIDTRLFVAPADKRELKQEFGLEGKLVIGTALRFIEQKGLQYLIASAPDVKRRFPDVRFLLVGDGRAKESLLAQVRALEVEDVFLFPGYRNDVVRILSAFDIYVLPSLWEGLPLGMIEAMLTGLPIVATDVGGVPEVLRDGENALLVPPGDSDALASALCRLAGSSELRCRLGEKACAHANAEYSLNGTVHEYERLYLNILAGK